LDFKTKTKKINIMKRVFLSSAVLLLLMILSCEENKDYYPAGLKVGKDYCNCLRAAYSNSDIEGIGECALRYAQTPPSTLTPEQQADWARGFSDGAIECADIGNEGDDDDDDDGNGGGNDGGDGGDENDPTKCSIAVFTGKDHGCGDITVTISGVGTKTLTEPYDPFFTPPCGDPATVTFSGLELGNTYHLYATCGTYEWESDITVTKKCYPFKLMVDYYKSVIEDGELGCTLECN
jgi:hypothetical protein